MHHYCTDACVVAQYLDVGEIETFLVVVAAMIA